jgi:phosphoglycerate dehydrogenase-like enzyme
MSGCLIVTSLADKFAEEVARLSDGEIPVKACTTSEQAVAEYTDETVLFGNPALIVPALPHMPTIDWVQSSWAGVTPFISGVRRDYVLTGVKDVFGSQMSEYVIGYLLAHELKVLQRKEAQKQRNWFKEISGSVGGKTLGVMGTGSIGQHIAGTARHFGMATVGLNRSGESAPNFDQVRPATELHEFLAEINHLVATLPQTEQTDNLLDANALAKLSPDTYFINVGRSNVVDDEALVNALRNGQLAGAALDVFDDEPLPKDSPLWDTPNLSITAHIAAISHPLLLVPIFVDNYRRYMKNEPLRYVIDFDAGY